MNTPENNHVRMTDILTCLRCNRMIAFRQALIQCVHCGFVAWYRAESATGTISYKQTPPTRPGTDILDYSLSHLQTQAVNDLASYPKPSCIMSDSQMKPMMIMLMFKLHNVNVYTSSIIQTAKPISLRFRYASLLPMWTYRYDNMFSFSYKFPQQERTMCKSPFPAFLFALQEWFFASCVTRVKKEKTVQ